MAVPGRQASKMYRRAVRMTCDMGRLYQGSSIVPSVPSHERCFSWSRPKRQVKGAAGFSRLTKRFGETHPGPDSPVLCVKATFGDTVKMHVEQGSTPGVGFDGAAVRRGAAGGRSHRVGSAETGRGHRGAIRARATPD